MRILLFIVFIGLAQGALCQRDTIEKKNLILAKITDLIERESYFVYVNISNPEKNFNGIMIEYYPDTKQIRYSKEIKNGITDNGFVTEYFKNGKIKSKYQIWKNDTIMNGHYSSFYENGKLQIDGYYKNGIKIGDWYFIDIKGDTNRIIYFSGIPIQISSNVLTDSIDLKKLQLKISNENKMHLKKYYYLNQLYNGIAINKYRHYTEKIFSYFEIRNGIIIKKKVSAFYEDGIKHFEFSTITDKNIKHGVENRWYLNGNRKSKSVYNYGEKSDTLFKWNKSGFLICKYDYINKRYIYRFDSIFFKNSITINLLSLLLHEYRLSYEYFIFKRQSLKLEMAYKPFQSDSTADLEVIDIIGGGTMGVKNTNRISTNKYISIAFTNYLKKYLNRKSLLYLSGEIYFLDKSYKNKNYTIWDYQYKSYGDKYYTTYLQSDHKKIYGFKFIFGLKQLLLKTNNKINLIYDIYTGIGFRYIDDLFTRYSESYRSNDLSYTKIPDIIYPVPKESHTYQWKPTINLVLKIGIAWRNK